MKKAIKILIVISLFLCVSNLYSQTLEEAKALYLKGEYAKALPAFETAIKTSPNNASYNQWYGKCLFETGKTAESEKYLKVAASKNVKDAHISLGKLYILQYRFKDAEKSYEDYMTIAKKEKKNGRSFGSANIN